MDQDLEIGSHLKRKLRRGANQPSLDCWPTGQHLMQNEKPAKVKTMQDQNSVLRGAATIPGRSKPGRTIRIPPTRTDANPWGKFSTDAIYALAVEVKKPEIMLFFTEF